MEFGEKLSEIRNNKSLSLRETARRSKISHPYLSQLESGKNKKPSPEIIRKLADGLNYSYNELMEAAGYVENIQYDSFKSMFEDSFKGQQRTIQVTLPKMKKMSFEDKTLNGNAYKAVSETELKRMLFDLKDWIDLDVDLFYGKKNLSKDDRERIKTMLKVLFEKEV